LNAGYLSCVIASSASYLVHRKETFLQKARNKATLATK